MTVAIEVSGLVKRFKRTTALDGIDLEVPEGTVLGLLGPNGAGKTTAVRIMTTLLKPDAGRATVLGLDVLRDADRVRAVIGVTGQYAAVDEYLTGFENLEMAGRLYHLPRAEVRSRARSLLEQFDLADAGDRISKTYSGGMRRRLDIAASLIARPRVLFLDEPTTGLDPRSRITMWEFIAALVGEGTTILLTTQYLEEADRLADGIAVVDHGRIIARGTADELKAQVGGERLEFTVTDAADLPVLADALSGLGLDRPNLDEANRTFSMPVSGGAGVLREALDRVADRVTVIDVGLRRPDLDDVFLTLTGRAAEVQPDGKPDERPARDRAEVTR
ncbi:ATP-binding cassette domain-containing protein [Nakamurella leprariae]|uniref:ATP-binding cassette domain-containing protein n=1 Tax=Nakamurella leprariae TaxID=2803911 RepID=A0A939BYQ1_9ACTN|nr:ATP-binding cassette domain-containing protein [Nakamurella leprariae]MBM9467320.1 ATP-binding cassette domain-containing protein [Nakamurella leprariae]